MANLDLNPQQKALIQQKVARRAELRQEFLKQVSNPYRHATAEGGYVFDPAMQRFASLKANYYHYFKPTSKAAWNAFYLFVLPVAAYGYIVKKSRDQNEADRRAGKVAYKDREFKFC